MSPTPTLACSSTRYILSLPQGKPNTKISLKNGVADERPRVMQSPQKGDNCAFYAMKILRKRIGPNPGSDYTEARRIEKYCSDFCKNRTVIGMDMYSFFPMILNNLNNGFNPLIISDFYKIFLNNFPHQYLFDIDFVKLTDFILSKSSHKSLPIYEKRNPLFRLIRSELKVGSLMTNQL